MNRKAKMRMAWWFSLISGGIIALLWTWQRLVAGFVPVTTEILWTPEKVIRLPFEVSRWWDIFIGPIWSFILVYLFTNDKVTQKTGLVIGLIVGLIAGLGAGLGAGLIVGLGVGLVGGLIAGMGGELVIGLGVGLGAGLIAGLGTTLIAGLGVGLGVGLALCLGMFFRFFSKISVNG